MHLPRTVPTTHGLNSTTLVFALYLPTLLLMLRAMSSFTSKHLESGLPVYLLRVYVCLSLSVCVYRRVPPANSVALQNVELNSLVCVGESIL